MMHNIFFWFLMLVINFSCILFAYRKFGKIGLYIWVPISTILANIQVVILVNLFGMEATLGNILYAGGFLITDILSENYGKKAANTAVKIGFFSLVATTLIMQCAIHFKPLDVPEGLAIFESVKSIFSLLPRLAIASLIAYLISQFHDVWLYEKIREKFPANMMKYGNTSAASIPILLSECVEEGLIHLDGSQKILLSGFGGGLTWGTLIVTI